MYGKQSAAAISALALAVVLAGCAAPLVAVPRPLTGRCETTFNPPPLPPPPVHRQTDEGTCELAPLGTVQFHSVKEINFAAGTQTTTEATLTAPNGDILRAVGSGTSTPSQPGRVAFTATLTFTGGTGRFAEATGEASVRGEAVMATRTASFEIVEGWITYDGSDRSGS